jgi:hypothetical protein
MDANALPMPPALLWAQSPDLWSERFARIRVPISAEAIHKRAIAEGQFYDIGRRILLTGEHIEKLFAKDRTPEARKARSFAARLQRAAREGKFNARVRRMRAETIARGKRRKRKP